MRHIYLIALFLLATCLPTRAQVFIINDNMTNGRMAEISATVVDSLTKEPIAYASFYVIPAKDTTISNFTLSDAEGKAKLEEVPFGEYFLHVEMLGYKPIIKKKFFRNRREDLGEIKLQADEKYLEAAVVSDVGNPIVVKKDTVEFNASSFQVGTNAMLKDLLKRMPGMEITDDGKVTFNGQAIDKLTVGGRTFFFDDQSTALNNLPASIVDKIRVIDRESEKTRDTGMQDGSREKVLDVALKKEYEKGWFGNAGVKGGTTFSGDKDDPLRDDRGLLYSGNALVSAYSEKDQVTVIANGMNINDSNGVVFVSVNGRSTDFNEAMNMVGLSSAAQLGINANTSRIKNFESTLGANYKYGDSRSGSKSFRTTFQDDGDVFSSSERSGRSFSNSLSANTEFKKENGKVKVRFGPRFSYSKNNSFSNSFSETSKGGSLINNSKSDVHRLGTSRDAYNFGSLTFTEIGGKKKRMINFNLDLMYGDSDEESQESSLVKMVSSEENRSLKYFDKGKSEAMRGGISYAEPIGEKLLLQASASLSYNKDNNIKDAFDAAGRNDYYSSESRVTGKTQSYSMTAQYNFTDKTWMTLGAGMDGELTETWSKSFGIEATTGQSEWYWHLAPRLRFQHSSGNNRWNFSTSGYSSQPSQSSMLPRMNITDPARPTIGNIYLRPNGYSFISASWNNNNREKFSTLMASMYGNIDSNPVTYARWYDSDGILYSVPVNARKNMVSGSLFSNYTTPLDGKKRLFLTLGLSGGISRSTSYQAKGTLEGLDKDSFDYSSFMESFWGTAAGERFYSGESGFAESTTTTFSPRISASVRYNAGGISGSVNASTSRNIARYSVDPNLNLNTADNRIGANASYSTKHEFEFTTDISYNWYNGYPVGYGAPEWQWNGEISKNIKAFTLSLKINDILDQTRNLTHTVTANYEEDTYSLVMGRYILFGLKWNFGKMNAAHSQRAQSAAWNMAF